MIDVERIDANSYLSIAGWATQTLRVGDVQGQVPIALPVIDYRRRITDPLLGGRFELQANSLAITRTSRAGYPARLRQRPLGPAPDHRDGPGSDHHRAGPRRYLSFR